MKKCDICGKIVPESELTEYAGEYYCADCAEEYLTTCERCGEIVSYDDAYKGYDGYLCENCHDDLFR